MSLFTCRSISIFPLTSLIIFSEKGTKGEKVNLEVGMKAELNSTCFLLLTILSTCCPSLCDYSVWMASSSPTSFLIRPCQFFNPGQPLELAQWEQEGGKQPTAFPWPHFRFRTHQCKRSRLLHHPIPQSWQGGGCVGAKVKIGQIQLSSSATWDPFVNLFSWTVGPGMRTISYWLRHFSRAPL